MAKLCLPGSSVGRVERDVLRDLPLPAVAVRADVRESDISTQLGEIAKANPGVTIGGHPFFDPQHGPNTNVVLRASDAQKLQRAKRAVQDMLERVRGAQSGKA